MALGLFGRKKGGEGAGGEGGAPTPGDGAGNGQPGRSYAPDKAARFFERAKVAYETANFEYAMTMWLSGLRQDPTNMNALESFFNSCKFFLGENGKPSKETRKMFEGKEEIDRYLSSILQWGMSPSEAGLAVRACEHAAALGLQEPTYWLGERALGFIALEKKPRKDLFLKMMVAFAQAGIADKAVEAAQYALRLDPTDGKLAAEIRNLSAQATMAKGGYEQAGEAGGFRSNVRDLEKQRRLDESERIVKSEDTLDRLVNDAAEDYAKRADDPAAIMLYAKRLMERGRPEDEKRAREVLKRGYETTKQFRFRETEGVLKLRIAQRKLAKYRDDAEQAKGDAKAAELYKQAQAQYAAMEIEEFKLRVDNYPTDLGLKFELGKRYFGHGDTEQAIALFQQSQEDARHRVESLNYLGQAFHKIGWVDEAVHTFRKALESHKTPSDEMGMELRYGLLISLQSKAQSERDQAIAEEADQLASAIAVQQIGYRDVRARRDAIKKLIAELKRGE